MEDSIFDHPFLTPAPYLEHFASYNNSVQLATLNDNNGNNNSNNNKNEKRKNKNKIRYNYTLIFGGHWMDSMQSSAIDVCFVCLYVCVCDSVLGVFVDMM